jgi:hypothetical protein
VTNTSSGNVTGGSLVEGCSVTINNAEGIEADGLGDTIVNNRALDNSLTFGNAEIYAHGTLDTVENNRARNSYGGHIGFYIDGSGSQVFGNSSSAQTGYYISGSCGCDVGTISTAAAATNPRGNID